ncbi:hypothetical protein THAOC_26645 [Thalassiosira oceanica]|uniref:Uncharacterized protein n=1 Tax=Thalassiosira oceanica TaxID=159749 RepID=K0S4L2_THAOC|nr:hypothetical protein THAOC_26645 [Thalassiosira oceanica]|eukprot:EJK53837.1 hypothetical protein THAOC_26645 [Thalassiosira oceanica]
MAPISRGALIYRQQASCEETVLETIPEESTVLSTVAIAPTITDGRCTSVEDSSDTRRKRIGFPSEIVRAMDSPDTGLVSPSALDDRVATDVLSGDDSPLRQFLTEAEQSTDGDPAQNDEDDV